MAKEDIAPYQKNLAIKQAFKGLGLPLDEVMDLSPFDLDMENVRLENLLDFVLRYRKYGNRQTMEIIENGPLFPPIFPGISPDSDWYRFELWMDGKPTRMKLSDQLALNLDLKKPEILHDEALDVALEQLETAMLTVGYGVCLHDGIPKRLVYEYLIETLDETFELAPGGCWHLDGCSGFCPGCFQRPWCETGQNSCWPEDEEAGKMSLIEALNPFIVASPQSLQILQRCQAEEDATFEKFKAENPHSDFEDPIAEEDWKAKLN